MSAGFLVAVVVILWALLVLLGNQKLKNWFKAEWGRFVGDSRQSRQAALLRRPASMPDSVADEHACHVEESPELLFPWFVPEWGGKCYEDSVYDVYVIARTGQTLTLPEFKEIAPPREGIIILDRILCHDFTGRFLFDASKAPRIYRFVTAFREGMALISDSGQTRFGFADRTTFGIAIPLDYREGHDFHNDVALVRLEQQWGFVDRAGRFTALPADADPHSSLPTISPLVHRSENSFPPCPARDFREGLAAVVSRQRWGYIDKSGNWAIPPRFDWAGSFSGGLAAVRSGTSCFYINQQGEVVIAGPFACARRFSDGLAPVRLSGPLWGLIDRSGALVVKPVWASVEACAEGVVPFTLEVNRQQIPRGGLYHVATGESQVLDRICRVFSFSEGVAVALRGGRLYGYLNTQGQPVVRDELRWSKASAFCEGLALVENEHM